MAVLRNEGFEGEMRTESRTASARLSGVRRDEDEGAPWMVARLLSDERAEVEEDEMDASFGGGRGGAGEGPRDMSGRVWLVIAI